MKKALSYQQEVDMNRTKLYLSVYLPPTVVDQNNIPFSIPDEKIKFFLPITSTASILPSKAYRVEIEFLRRDSLASPIEIKLVPSISFIDIWELKEIKDENEGVFEHPIMGTLNLKNINKSFKVGDKVKIRQTRGHYFHTYFVQHKIVY